jgi:hypothetical protein
VIPFRTTIGSGAYEASGHAKPASLFDHWPLER